MCGEHVVDMMNGSSHTERVPHEEPSLEGDPSGSWLGGVRCTARLPSAPVCCVRVAARLGEVVCKQQLSPSGSPTRTCQIVRGTRGESARVWGAGTESPRRALRSLVWISSSKQLSDVGAVAVPV